MSRQAEKLPDWFTAGVLAAPIATFAGLGVARPGSLPGVLVVGAVVIIGLTPIVVALGRWALPVWLALFGVLYPLVRFPTDDAVVTFDRLFLGALLIGYLFEHRRRAGAPEATWLQRSFVLFVAVFLLSALATAESTITGLAVWTDAFLLPLIVFLCAREASRDREQLMRIAGAMAVAGATIAIAGLAQKFAGLDLAPLLGSDARFDSSIREVRISGPFAVPEPFALALLSCLAGTLFWIRARGAPALVPGGLAIALELGAIFFTYFRAAWLGALIILLVAVVVDQRSWTRRAAAVTAAATCFALAFVVADKSESVQTRIGDARNVSGRLATYERGLELFGRHPVGGVGFQRFEKAVRDVPQSSFEGVRAVPEAHSSIVSTLAEQGLAGFVPLLACAIAIALALRALWRDAEDRLDRSLAIATTGAALAFLVMSLSLTMIYYGPSNAVIALLIGLTCGRLDVITDRSR